MGSGQHHEGFKARVLRSEPYRQLGRWIIEDWGHFVTMPQQTIAENYEDRREHSDNGDLVIDGKYVAEIKGSNYAFTNGNDFQFSWYFIAGQKPMDQTKPVWVFCINPPGTHFGRVRWARKSEWEVTPHYDRERGTSTPGYSCRSSQVDWYVTPEHVVERFYKEWPEKRGIKGKIYQRSGE